MSLILHVKAPLDFRNSVGMILLTVAQRAYIHIRLKYVKDLFSWKVEQILGRLFCTIFRKRIQGKKSGGVVVGVGGSWPYFPRSRSFTITHQMSPGNSSP